jgi:hypothetical protein
MNGDEGKRRIGDQEFTGGVSGREPDKGVIGGSGRFFLIARP